MSDEYRIGRVGVEDAGELLTLRRAAFVTTAQEHGDPNIPPLTQTLGELKADLRNPDVVTLGAWLGPRLVGSLRVLFEGTKATLGRFAVAPDLRGKGVGTSLMRGAVPYLPDDVSEVWVFTVTDSVQSLATVAGGYAAQIDQTAGDLTVAYIRKLVGEDIEDLGAW